MKSNVLTRDVENVAAADGLYGSNRQTYVAYSVGLAGNTKPYSNGKLQEQSHKSVTYDVAQKFPEHQLAEALKATQTELKQVHGMPGEFEYVQFAHGVEFQISNMAGADATNIRAGINNNMTKEWDATSFKTSAQNPGYLDHPRAAQITGGALSFATLVSQISAGLAAIKDISDVTSSDLSRVNAVINSAVAAVMDKYETGELQTNRERLEKLFPGLVFTEVPSFLMGGAGKVLLVLSEQVTFHHASMPGLYSTESGRHGMSEASLFVYESTAVELESDGVIQQINFS